MLLKFIQLLVLLYGQVLETLEGVNRACRRTARTERDSSGADTQTFERRSLVKVPGREDVMSSVQVTLRTQAARTRLTWLCFVCLSCECRRLKDRALYNTMQEGRFKDSINICTFKNMISTMRPSQSWKHRSRRCVVLIDRREWKLLTTDPAIDWMLSNFCKHILLQKSRCSEC